MNAPDECPYCYKWGLIIVKLDDNGNCTEPENHKSFGPGA